MLESWYYFSIFNLYQILWGKKKGFIIFKVKPTGMFMWNWNEKIMRRAFIYSKRMFLNIFMIIIKIIKKRNYFKILIINR